MSIKTHLMFAAVMNVAVSIALATEAKAGSVNCTMNYPDTNQAVGTDDGAVYYPNGAVLRALDGQMNYASGTLLMTPDGTMSYPNGALLKTPDGEVKYQSGPTLRDVAGGTFNEDGSTNAMVRLSTAVDADTQLVLRAWKRGSSYKLRLKTGVSELVVNIDDQTNVSCEFVKPTGPAR